VTHLKSNHCWTRRRTRLTARNLTTTRCGLICFYLLLQLLSSLKNSLMGAF
jgi:hypothetical protein